MSKIFFRSSHLGLSLEVFFRAHGCVFGARGPIKVVKNTTKSKKCVAFYGS